MIIDHIERQKQWSLETFGEGEKTEIIIDHIKEELQEISEDPHNIEEWIDVIILALDGAWRAGYSATDICLAIAMKQRINEQREWQNYRHIKTP